MREERRDRAILLRTYDLSESSLIVHWFCQNLGLCKTVVKGVKSKNSRYLGKLELFSFCEIHFLSARGESDLHSLINNEVIFNISALRTSYKKLLAASYFSLLIDYWLVSDQSVPEVYSLLERALKYLQDKDLEWRAVTYFEEEFSRLLGYSDQKDEVRKIYNVSPKVIELREKVKSSLVRP